MNAKQAEGTPGRKLSILLSISTVRTHKISTQCSKSLWMSHPHWVCCVSASCSSCSLLTISDLLFCYLFHLGSGQTPLFLLTFQWSDHNSKSPLLWVSICMHKTWWFSGYGVFECVGCSWYRSPLGGYFLASRLEKSHNEWNEVMISFSHFINTPWEISVSIDII